MQQKPRRLTYLSIGQAVQGLIVAAERSGNRLLTGHIVAIREAPPRRHPRARICTVKQANRLTFQESEDRLLVVVPED